MEYNLELKSNNFDTRGGAAPTILILHYTACPFDEAAFLLTTSDPGPGRSRVSSHYLIPSSGTNK
jgi:N-acetyl-anhydromuramyl-L-alanine amidase AmpD